MVYVGRGKPYNFPLILACSIAIAQKWLLWLNKRYRSDSCSITVTHNEPEQPCNNFCRGQRNGKANAIARLVANLAGFTRAMAPEPKNSRPNHGNFSPSHVRLVG